MKMNFSAAFARLLPCSIILTAHRPPPLAVAQPYSDCDVSTYYASLPNGNASPLDASRDDVHDLIKNTHRNQLPYTSTSPDVWDAMIALDGDALGQNVKLAYRDAWVAATPYDQGTCEYWNREHLWPRSLGVGSSGKDNTDVHHLRPADCNINAARSNNFFGACGTSTPSSQCISPAHPEAATDTEKDSTTFLPPQDARGDVARAILYMDLRYDGDEASTENLVVSDCPEEVPSGAGMGYLSQLLQWHLEDPPDVEEIQRNGKVCTDWQGNRNPFIDYPELASIYHGGSRPLLGDGLGYDCTVPPPPPVTGTCSDGSGTCTSTDQCSCAPAFTSTLFGRSLRGRSPFGRKLQSTGLIIAGVIDGPLPGGLPKAVELHALDDVPDLSVYGIGSANNGGGTDGQEFALSGAASSGSFITIASESVEFANYFGETPTFTSAAIGINGDDAIELFLDGAVVDTFGEINVDGTGQAWEYTDGWAYRNAGSAPGSAFDITEWTLGGANALDGCANNGSCGSSFPIKTFSSRLTLGPSASPTIWPTKSPTPCECFGASSSAPTTNPSKAPSQSPNTPHPTNGPSKEPTFSPTRNPTKGPTKSPSKNATLSPSNSPTEALSRSPTTSPSKGPSNAPATDSPTLAPTPGQATLCSTISKRKDCKNEPGCAWSRRRRCY